MTSRPSWTTIAVGALALLVVIVSLVDLQRVDRIQDKVAAKIRRDLKVRALPTDAPWRDKRTLALVRAFYSRRGMKPAWTNGRGPNDDAKTLMRVLNHAEEEGLDSGDYSIETLIRKLQVLERVPADEASYGTLAECDLFCSIAALHYMSDAHDGRISPRALDAVWVDKPHKNDMDARLDEALKKHRLEQALEELPPQREEYANLKKARARASGEKLRLIELNMERWRWLPGSFGDRYLIVNIPEYRLHLIEDGRDALDMKVVVGKVMSQTPVFSDTMTAVVVNPTWSVPPSIVRNEIVPAIAEDPDYLAKHRMRVVGTDGDTLTDFDLSDSTQKVIVRQDAGEGNALGSLKFIFPNSFDIYLHDTPAGHLFDEEERSFSHGCIRVEDPVALAHAVLRGRPESNEGRIRALIAAGETKTISLPERLPVHIVYFTASADADGNATFLGDVYGIDQDLSDRLSGRARKQAAARTKAEALAGRAKRH